MDFLREVGWGLEVVDVVSVGLSGATDAAGSPLLHIILIYVKLIHIRVWLLNLLCQTLNTNIPRFFSILPLDINKLSRWLLAQISFKKADLRVIGVFGPHLFSNENVFYLVSE